MTRSFSTDIGEKWGMHQILVNISELQKFFEASTMKLAELGPKGKKSRGSISRFMIAGHIDDINQKACPFLLTLTGNCVSPMNVRVTADYEKEEVAMALPADMLFDSMFFSYPYPEGKLNVEAKGIDLRGFKLMLGMSPILEEVSLGDLKGLLGYKEEGLLSKKGIRDLMKTTRSDFSRTLFASSVSQADIEEMIRLGVISKKVGEHVEEIEEKKEEEKEETNVEIMARNIKRYMGVRTNQASLIG